VNGDGLDDIVTVVPDPPVAGFVMALKGEDVCTDTWMVALNNGAGTSRATASPT
jgi:hypothetical protein